MKIIISFILLAVDFLAMALFKRYPAFFFPAYRHFSAALMNGLAKLSSNLSFTLWDLLLVGLLVYLLIYFLRQGFRKGLIQSFFLVSLLGSFAILGWALNHYAPPLAQELGMVIREHSKEELIEASEYYLKKAQYYSALVARAEDGSLVVADKVALAKAAGNVHYFSLLGDYLMYNGISGMFMPLTGEAGVPGNEPLPSLGFTMCHEAAHRQGIAAEQEANFMAFLDCIGRDDAYFCYSGYFQAFRYCYNALYKIDKEAAFDLLKRGDSTLLLRDMADEYQVYKKYESPLQDVSDKINDTYLKTFSQEEGSTSYGQVVDYLLAYYDGL